jgi:hypothetical protein
MHLVQPREIQTAPIHPIERASLDKKKVQYIHLMHLAIAHVNEGGDNITQINNLIPLISGPNRGVVAKKNSRAVTTLELSLFTL